MEEKFGSNMRKGVNTLGKSANYAVTIRGETRKETTGIGVTKCRNG